MQKATGTTTLSCTIPSELGRQLNLIAQIEERSKSYYVKKALQSFLDQRLEDALLASIGEDSYKEYLQSGEEGIPYDKIRTELKLDDK